MIGYFDTSALVPLMITEPGTASCRRFWDDADDVVTSILSHVEAAAALAHARRLGRLTEREHNAGLRILNTLWSSMQVIQVDDRLMDRAASLANELGLRAYDAVHCASAASIRDPDLVAASGDGRLLGALSELGIATFDPNND